MRRIAALILVLVVIMALAPVPAIANTGTWMIDVASPGWYVVSNWTGGASIVDAYGNPIQESQYYVLTSSDWLPTGLYVYLPAAGRYYIIPSNNMGKATLVSKITYNIVSQPSNTMAEYNTSIIDSVDATTTANNHYTSTGSLKLSVLSNQTGQATGWNAYIEYTVYAITTANFNVTITYTGYYDPDFPRPVTVELVVDGGVASQHTFNYTDTGMTVNLTAKLTSGNHVVQIKFQIGQPSAVEHPGDWYMYNIDVSINKAVGSIVNYTVIQAQEAPSINITYDPQKVTVYAHNFTITSTADQQLEWFIVPVDTSEVSQLTSLNPVVLDVKTNSIRPARLVTIGGQEFLVFQAWSNGTSNQYTVIWNYPQTVTVQDVFSDQFTSDPLLAWQEQVRSNVSRVEYNSNKLYVYGDGYDYIIARALDYNYTAGIAYVKADYKQVWIGNASFEYAPYMYPEEYTVFIAGELLGANVTISTSSIGIQMRHIYTYNYTGGTSIAIGVHSDTNTTAVIGGVIAVPHMIKYNATFDRQLLRLSMNIDHYSIKYSTSSSVGYWTHVVQVVIYYDPTALPPTDYFNVRLILPETEWLQQGLCRPGLADIAITDSENHLVPFWIEPYQLPDGSRAVWVKLPADTSKNMYVLNILLNNTKLTTSLATPSAFIQYYSETYGLGSSWSQDADGYITTQNPYVNTIVIVPSGPGFSFKLALTPSDYYIVKPEEITETHSLETTSIHTFNGFFIQSAVHWVYFEKNGHLQYYQGNTLLWEVNDLNKPWTWPPMILGASNATFIGLAILVPYSYSIGTVTGGQWGYNVDSQQVQVGSNESHISWSHVGEMVVALIPLVIIALVMRLVNNPPSVSRSVSGGGIT